MADPPAPRPKRALVEALAALAARDRLGETVDWRDVEAAILALLADPVGLADLRAILERMEDPRVPAILEDWFVRAAAAREADGRSAGRTGEKILAPFQAVSLGVLATTGLAFAAGTLGTLVAAPVFAGALVLSASATYGRWRLAKRDDEAAADAEAIRRFAEAARRAR